jgi:hypothetical protein
VKTPCCPTCGQTLSSTLPGFNEPSNGNGKQRRDRPLPFDVEVYKLRDAILVAVWECLEPFIGRAQGVTAWKDANRKHALAMARQRIAPSAAVAGWKQATKRIGEPVRSVKIVHDEIIGAHARRAAAHA